MTPINTLAKAVISGENEVVTKMLTTLKIELDSEEREL
jgi:hypothetical protein